MWSFDSINNRWSLTDDKVTKFDFDLLKQELQATRFYSKCLSGATYLPVNDLSDIYDILGKYDARNWYISTVGSQYSVTNIPPQHAAPIDSDTSYDYYTKYLSEYGLTLKNLFTPNRLLKDSFKNFYTVDLATTVAIDFTQIGPDFKVDGVRPLEGHLILVKDQTTNVVLPSTSDPNVFFSGNYEVVESLGATTEYRYYNEENGIYRFTGGELIKTTILDYYDQCVRFSVSVKVGQTNVDKEFHLSRLLNGYYPTTSLNQPIEFKERSNWILRNRVDYNNLFETNYYDVYKHGTQSYNFEGVTYSIPQRTIAIGEFGIILNTQETKSNVIPNKYKVNLRSITETSIYYWICGDEGMLLRVRKHDFEIKRITVDCLCPRGIVITNLKSISFFNELRGVAVGDLNTILVTKDGGTHWERIKISDFDSYYYNKVIYTSNSIFYIGGNTGVFIEMTETIAGWVAYKKRVYKQVDTDDDIYLLVDNINDLYKTTINTWGLSYSFFTQSIDSSKELVFIAADNNHIIAYDVNGVSNQTGHSFIYFDFDRDYGDIKNITRKSGTDYFYFTGSDSENNQQGLFQFDINNFPYLGTVGSFSNTTIGLTFATFDFDIYSNEIFDYDGVELYVAGNDGLLKYSTYSIPQSFSVLDSTYLDKLKSKLLVLDYDIASKLNFFTDAGDYRLPNSLTFSVSSFTGSGDYLAFSPIQHPLTSTNNGTYSETNWITYWTDAQKTFTYYTNTPLDESVKVLMSTTFSYSNISSDILLPYVSGSQRVTSSASVLSSLAPMIVYATQSRYDSQGLPAISVPPSFVESIVLYDYLMIIKVSTSYPVVVGDVIRFDSSVVTGDFIVNRIETFGTNKFIYMFTEFNQNIINDLIGSTQSISYSNLNKYTTDVELKNKFNTHPISNAYELNYLDSDGLLVSTTSNVLEISSQFNNLTSYYNLATNINLNGTYSTMEYTSAFLNFGYSPTYNLLDYLQGLNDTGDPNPKFYATKEYLAMPVYKGLPLGSLTASTVYIDFNGMTYSGGSMSMTGNKIIFGSDFKLEWESIFVNTFVDVNIYGSSTYTTERLLVLEKYIDNTNNSYIIEFHKRLNFTLGDAVIGNGGTLDIISRRKLWQISEDLQQLNNIQRTKSKTHSWKDQNLYSYQSYQNELNFKIPTDSYAKILMSDTDTVQQLSAIIYVDYKNELSLNITRLSKEYEVPILNTANYLNKLYISCSEKHDLVTGDGVILKFTGGVGSSQELNQQYFGYHVITKVNEYDFYTEVDYGNIPLVGNDLGVVTYTKQDPFFNYAPVDLIDVGSNRRAKQSIELTLENIDLVGDKYRLIDVDFNKYRFRLVDGLDLEIISLSFPWILEAEISGAVIGINGTSLVWYKGTWECGRWFGGTWNSGTWMSGDWYGGTWNSLPVVDKYLTVEVDEKSTSVDYSLWFEGRWYDGTWNNGTWINGRWYGGTWNNGEWYKGIWNDGTWNNGIFQGGIWVLGTWNNGIFNTDNDPAYWIDGSWYGGDFENGMWYNGIFEQKNGLSRFGTKAYNSRTANWQAGKWVSGSFYSKLNTDDNGQLTVSDVHKYSIWRTGQWLSGEWYGGIAYNMDFRTGTWFGGILEDIQVIGIDTVENTFILNGIFKFNIGDNIYMIDNQYGGTYSVFGSNLQPGVYKVLYQKEDTAVFLGETIKTTIIYVNYNLATLGSSVSVPTETNLRVVSKFRNLNWKSGIWTNGLFETGLWEGGIWYNGVFDATWS